VNDVGAEPFHWTGDSEASARLTLYFWRFAFLFLWVRPVSAEMQLEQLSALLFLFVAALLAR
jgi:hypothetical protein